VRSTVTDLGDPPAGLKIMTEEALTKDMEAFIGAKPRAWHDILKQYHGQPYPVLYRAFGNLRHRLGRTNDPPWYRYTLSATPFSWEAKPQPMNHSDPRHIKTAG
jgi:2,5-furandicarboxylate decarboxylase 1